MSEQKSEKAPSVANLRAMREKVATQDAEAASRSRTSIPVESHPTSESPRFGEKAQPGSFLYYDSETAAHVRWLLTAGVPVGIGIAFLVFNFLDRSHARSAMARDSEVRTLAVMMDLAVYWDRSGESLAEGFRSRSGALEAKDDWGGGIRLEEGSRLRSIAPCKESHAADDIAVDVLNYIYTMPKPPTSNKLRYIQSAWPKKYQDRFVRTPSKD